MSLGSILAGLTHELRRSDNGPADKLLRIGQRGVGALGLGDNVRVTRRVIVELATPPKQFRGLRDLVVRRGSAADLDALATIDDTDPALVRARLARGDLAYVGELAGRVLCHTWFHRGPTSFDEDRAAAALWELDASTAWSFNGAACTDARTSGVFVKLFQTALGEMFEVHGMRRVQGYIHDTNHGSLAMHKRMGFTFLGTLVAVAVPGVKWLRWDGAGSTRQWVVRRAGDLALAFPPG